ncbi:MAG TPA: DUF364 domain-containing protein [bacterium]|nr:DUF364 domain-containing protein [bacterium]
MTAAVAERRRRVLAALLNAGGPDQPLQAVVHGARVTAVRGERVGVCASMLRGCGESGAPEAALQAGRLRTMAQWLLHDDREAAVFGLAALNALLPLPAGAVTDGPSVIELIMPHAVDKRVAVIGRFPFIPALRATARQVVVLEEEPRDGELPADAAGTVLPEADLVIMSGTTLANHTFCTLCDWCAPRAMRVMVGPSTPLSDILLDSGFDYVAGAKVTDADGLLRGAAAGLSFRQLHQRGYLVWTTLTRRRR